MTLPVFAPPPGLTFPVGRKPMFQTLHQESVSGKDNPIQLWPYPRRQWTIDFDLLRSDAAFLELQYMEGFFNSVAGSARAWLFSDPDDNAVTGQPFGLGDGANAQFGLVRAFGGFVDPIFAPVPTPTIYVDGLPAVNFSLGAQGLITFTSPPAIGAILTWTGSFNWVVRFDSDELPLSKFMDTFFELRKLSFTTVPLSFA